MTYVDQLAFSILEGQRAAFRVNDLTNRLDMTYGVVVDVEDPEERGRVRIILDETNPKYIEEEYGYPQTGQPTETDWIEPIVPFAGKQPKDLIKTRVSVFPRNADPNRLFFGDPVYDKYGQQHQERSANQPRNSAMTRLPIYDSGQLPPASEDNFGCMVIEKGGPLNNDWLCVCLRRKGKWYWVRHLDIAHIHASQDDGSQGPDSAGNGQQPVKESVIWDRVATTTHLGAGYATQSKNPMDSGFFSGAN